MLGEKDRDEINIKALHNKNDTLSFTEYTLLVKNECFK